jgi:ribosomal protein S18 acetylase RimI-like enzyme
MQVLMTNELPISRTDEVVEHLLKPRLWIPHADYPDYSLWIDRVHEQLRKETKRSMVALEGGRVVGVVLYQQHRSLSQTLEIKNISVRPEKAGRYIASFLLRNAEIEGAREYQAQTVTVDAKAGNKGIRLFLLAHRYRITQEQDLYGLGSGPDLVFTKVLA